MDNVPVLFAAQRHEKRWLVLEQSAVLASPQDEIKAGAPTALKRLVDISFAIGDVDALIARSGRWELS